MSFPGKWLPTTCAALALVGSCAHASNEPSSSAEGGRSEGHLVTNLRKRAAHDLSCRPETLRLNELASGTWGVTGCGKRATYILARAAGSAFRQWVMDSVSHDPAAASRSTASSAAPTGAGVQVTRDERGNSLYLELAPAQSTLRMRLKAKPALVPDHVLVGFQQKARKQNDQPCEVRVVANGALMDAPPPKYERTADRNERWTFELPTETVIQLARAQRVVAQVCAERVELGRNEMAQLAEFMVRFLEEQALAGQVRADEQGAKEPAPNTAL